MSASNSQGIHTLLEAEKEASKIVAQARDYRVKRLKDARSEAAKDIAEIQSRKNGELEEIQKKNENQSALEEKIQSETKEKLAGIQAEFEKNKKAAVSKLIEAITIAEA